MAVEINDVRKVVELKWDTDKVKGATVSIDVDGEEKRTNIKNDGLGANVTYPGSYTGESHITIRGSHGGEDSGTITVP